MLIVLIKFFLLLLFLSYNDQFYHKVKNAFKIRPKVAIKAIRYSIQFFWEYFLQKFICFSFD